MSSRNTIRKILFLTRQLLVAAFDFRNEHGTTVIRRFASPRHEKSEALATEFSSVQCLFVRYLKGDGVQHESVEVCLCCLRHRHVLQKNPAVGCYKWCVAFYSGECFIPQCTLNSMCTFHSIAGLQILPQFVSWIWRCVVLCCWEECAGREGPSGPDAPRPYVQALCAPFLIVISSLIHLWWQSRAARRESHLLAKEGTV
jgi:hypothetical protein